MPYNRTKTGQPSNQRHLGPGQPERRGTRHRPCCCRPLASRVKEGFTKKIARARGIGGFRFKVLDAGFMAPCCRPFPVLGGVFERQCFGFRAVTFGGSRVKVRHPGAVQ